MSMKLTVSFILNHSFGSPSQTPRGFARLAGYRLRPGFGADAILACPFCMRRTILCTKIYYYNKARDRQAQEGVPRENSPANHRRL